MKRFPIFFLASMLLTAAMIGVSAFSAMPRNVEAVGAKRDNGALVFDAAALNQLAQSSQTPVTPAPGPRRDQSGPRLVSESPFSAQNRDEMAAKLNLNAQTASALRGKPIMVQIVARGLPNNPATKFGFGVAGSTGIVWQEGNVPSAFQAIQFVLPATTQPVTALVFWPSVSGNGLGIEIKSITILSQDGSVL